MNQHMVNKAKQQLRSLRRQLTGNPEGSPYEDVIRAEMRFYIDYIKNGMIVFDVGANIGTLTLLFSNLAGENGKVYAFEASSQVFQQLKIICDASRRDYIHPNHLAMSDSDGYLKLNIYEEKYSTWNTLADRPLEKYGLDVRSIGCESVLATTLDSFCYKNNIDTIDLLKIDVEGAEFQVLSGAKKMLQEKRIKCCIFEFGGTTFDMGNNPRQIQDYLSKSHYKIRNLIPGDPIFPGHKNALSAHFSMHIATPK